MVGDGIPPSLCNQIAGERWKNSSFGISQGKEDTTYSREKRTGGPFVPILLVKVIRGFQGKEDTWAICTYFASERDQRV